MRKITLAFSTCPNDTFCFDAIANKKLPDPPFEFDVQLADISVLNQMVSEQNADIIKISYAHLPDVIDNYIVLTAGGALGFNCGPLLIAKNKDLLRKEVSPVVAIPGVNTTANFLFKRYFPQFLNKKEMLFSDIEAAVVNDKVEAGLIIHESRFTYKQKGLFKIADLGSLWHEETNLPIPLGCIVARRSFSDETLALINEAVYQSVKMAMDTPEITTNYVKSMANSLDDNVIKQHIELYVNEYSIDIGAIGKKGVNALLGQYLQKDFPIFVDDIS